MKDVLIKNGLVVTAEKEEKADLLLSGGCISAIGPSLGAPADVEIIDAAGLLIMPGGVDVHTHLDLAVPPAKVSDGWLAGTLAAAFGGVTSVVEHPGFGPAGCSLHYQLDFYKKNAAEAIIDYGLHGVFQHWNDKIKAEIASVVASGCSSFKAYMTYDGRLEDEDFLKALRALNESGGLMTVHAENHAIVSALAAELKISAPGRAGSHPLSRPDYAEALAVETAICLAEAAGGTPLYIVHLSTAKGLAAVRRAKAEGKKVWAETCPQYLMLTDSCYQGDFNQALKYVMAPVPRKRADVEALWEGLFDGGIDTVATDHCSFSWWDKIKFADGNVFKCPGGIPGVESRLPLLYSEGVIKRGLDRKRFVELVATSPAELFGLDRKGDIQPGFDADLVIFDPAEEKIITSASMHQKVDYSPFENVVARGWPKMVFSRGEKIIDGERFVSRPGRGKFICRQPFSIPRQRPAMA